MPRAAREVPWLEVRDGVYYVYWYDKPGKRTRRLSFRTGDAAQAAGRYAEFLRQGADVYNRQSDDGPTVNEVLSHYEQEHVNGTIVRNGRVEPRMVAKGRTMVCIGHLRRHLGPDPVKNLGVTACEGYLAKRRADPFPVSDPTVRREISILAAAINHDAKRKRVEFNTRHLWLPAASHPKNEWLTYDQLDALRRTAVELKADVVRDFTEVAYYTASRSDAVMTLSLFQVKLAENQIALDKPGAVKTKKRRPTVPIDDALRPTIERLYAEAVAAGRTYLLPPVGNRSDRRILEHFKTVAKAAGLPTNVTPHTLRHTRATHLLQKGASIWEVAKLLGDTVATVDRVYGHHCTEAVAEALKAHRREG